MKDLFRPGDQKVYEKRVTENDFAQFEAGLVHAVCGTFALAQAAEWASRLFVLEMKDADEEGIGTMVLINHCGPAFSGETITITATVKSLDRNDLICTYEAKVGDRLVAIGETGQKILKKEKLSKILQTPSEADGQSER
jgi:fluoroacetyl-CoA thioesterase